MEAALECSLFPTLRAEIHYRIFHRKSIGRRDGLLHKFPPPDGVAEIYVVAYPSVRYFSDGKSDSVSGPLMCTKCRRETPSIESASFTRRFPTFQVRTVLLSR